MAKIEAKEARQGKTRGKVAEKIYDHVHFYKYVVRAHPVLQARPWIRGVGDSWSLPLQRAAGLNNADE